jgi:hypothetical protein
MTGVVKGIGPFRAEGGLDEDHRPAAGPRINAEEEAGLLLPFDMNLVDAKFLRLERFEEMLVFGFSGGGRKRHTQALMDAVEIPQPQPPGPGTIGVVPHVN